MENNVLGIVRLLQHHVHSITMQNNERRWFAPEFVIRKSHCIPVMIGRLHDIFDQQDWRRCGQSGAGVGTHIALLSVEFHSRVPPRAAVPQFVAEGILSAA